MLLSLSLGHKASVSTICLRSRRYVIKIPLASVLNIVLIENFEQFPLLNSFSLDLHFPSYNYETFFHGWLYLSCCVGLNWNYRVMLSEKPVLLPNVLQMKLSPKLRKLLSLWALMFTRETTRFGFSFIYAAQADLLSLIFCDMMDS